MPDWSDCGCWRMKLFINECVPRYAYAFAGPALGKDGQVSVWGHVVWRRMDSRSR